MTTPQNPPTMAFKEHVLLCDMQRVLILMESVNRNAAREESLGGWLSDHGGYMRELELEFQVLRQKADAMLAAREKGQPQ